MAPPPVAELTAPHHWRTVDFISDLHLQPAEPLTVQAWQRYLADTPADAVFILGDLFEAWPGDDDLAGGSGFSHDRASELRSASSRMAVYFMHGNRDFLVGSAFAAATGVQLLQDPTAVTIGSRRLLLSHGDALCLEDTEYLQFRAMARDPGWQQRLLARPLAERQALAVSLRTQSEDRKRLGVAYADVDAQEAVAWLQAGHADTLVHGHTHKPAEHALGAGLRRVVLSDWDLAAIPPRAEALRMDAAGLKRVPLA